MGYVSTGLRDIDGCPPGRSANLSNESAAKVCRAFKLTN